MGKNLPQIDGKNLLENFSKINKETNAELHCSERHRAKQFPAGANNR